MHHPTTVYDLSGCPSVILGFNDRPPHYKTCQRNHDRNTKIKRSRKTPKFLNEFIFELHNETDLMLKSHDRQRLFKPLEIHVAVGAILCFCRLCVCVFLFSHLRSDTLCYKNNHIKMRVKTPISILLIEWPSRIRSFEARV